MTDSNTITWLFEAICDTPIWNSSLSWDTSSPSLTECFTDTALSWPPTLFLWITSPYMLYDYYGSRRSSIQWSCYNRIKHLLAALLAIVGLVHAIHVTVMGAEEQFTTAKSHVVAMWLDAATYLLFLLYITLQRRKGFVNGGAIWFYLILQLVTNSVQVAVEHGRRPTAHLVYIYLELACQVVLFVMASFPEKISNIQELLGSPYLYGQLGDREIYDDELKREESKNSRIVCPKETASFPSKLTFWWFNSLSYLGYRRPLVIDDLWEIRLTDRCTELFHQFNHYWGHPIFARKSSPEAEVVNGKSNGHHVKRMIFSRKDQYSIHHDDDLGPSPPKLEKCALVRAVPEEYETPKTSLMSILGRNFWFYFLLPSLARLFTDLLQLVNPMVLKFMISFTQSDEPFWHGILYSVVFVLTNIVQSFSSAYHQHRMSALGMRIRSCLIASIYRKSLVLASSAKKNYTTGEIVNLMAVDSQRFIDMVPWICFLWTAPVMIGIGFYLLWQELGIAVLGGLAVMIGIIPLNGVIAHQVKKLQTQQMKHKDARLKAVNEMLSGMKVLKLYAWEEAFVENIEKIRRLELSFIRKSGFISTVFVCLSSTSPFLVSCVTFALYIVIDKNNVLNAEKAFVSISLFNLLRIPLTMIPNMLSSLVLTMVSVKRITNFLNSDETKDYVTRHVHETDAVSVKNASFTWDTPRPDHKPTIILNNLNITIPKGKLVAVVGSVGSGKSSFLYSLLGEMQKLSGQVNISGDLKMAYVPQQAWIQNSTVRGNILFGSSFSKKKYDQVIEACALKSDFEMLSGGDQTEIGEKGINLSGGQKQRVSIARACYSDADVYLFDDPLSAVDSHVGKHIFEEVLSTDKGILTGKTRVLVTNALYMLPFVDQVVLIRSGTIDAVGSYQQLLDENKYFFELITNYLSNQQDEDEEEGVDKNESDLNLQEVDGDLDPSSVTKLMMRTISQDSVKKDRALSLKITRSLSQTQTQQQSTEAKSEETTKAENKSKGKLVEVENVEVGNISWHVYKRFVQALSLTWFFTIFVMYIGSIGSNTGSNFWLSAWTDKKDQNREETINSLLIYFGIGMCQVFFVCFGWMSIIMGTLNASTNLHSKLMKSIVHAPMYFFDTTPLGRIVNRFSKDVDTVDTYIQFLIRVLLNTTLQVVATLFIICFNTPFFLAFVIPFIVLYYFIQRFYVTTSRQLKRLEAVTRSPILNHFGETINGVSTIKAYNATERFIQESDQRVDQNQKCFYPNAVANCWLQVRLEFLANCLIFFAALFAALSKIGVGPNLSGSETGLSLSYALNVTLSLNWCVRMFAEMENNVVSVERIHEYTDVPPEAPWRVEEDKNVSKTWPEKGAIDFTNYATRYRPGLDLVLKGIDLAVKQGEKVGIVGRTGAGKSSLTLALFRIIEAAQGSIMMDGINISKLGLNKLRSRITIIPQDPVLFCGTIRFNLDPFNSYTDEQLWTVLELAHLKPFVSSLEEGLEYIVAEAGENLSVGQRQLVCLARALLRRTNVLVLDEATAAVDLETDNLIQETIRSEFADCTVLTIAHRLHTILDSDRVMVLDAGKIAEFDAPKTLLGNSNSIFYSLAKDAGIVGNGNNNNNESH